MLVNGSSSGAPRGFNVSRNDSWSVLVNAHFFVIRRSSAGSNAVVYSKVGSIQDLKEFLDMIIKETGLR